MFWVGFSTHRKLVSATSTTSMMFQVHMIGHKLVKFGRIVQSFMYLSCVLYGSKQSNKQQTGTHFER